MKNLEMIQSATLIAFAIFAVAMVAVGAASYRKVKGIDSFLIGGRNIGGWLSAFAYGTSYFSAVIFVGYAGKHGWDIGIGAVWIGIGNAVLGCFLSWKFLAKRTRDLTHKLDAKTMPEFFGARYKSKKLKIFAAIIIFIFLVPYSAAVYKGLGYIFTSIFPSIPVNYCMLAIAIITGIYLILGGYIATAQTDFIQGIIMVGGIICMVIAILSNDAVGGLFSGLEKLGNITDNGDGITGNQLTSIFGGDSVRFLCVNILLTSFGTWGLPQMVNKYYAVKDDHAIKQATVISTGFCLLIGVGAYLCGAFSRLILGNNLPEAGYDGVIPNMLIEALGGSPTTIVIMAVIVILLFSASMSTLSSIVLSSSSAVSVDLVPEFFKNFGGKKQLTLTRCLCLIFIALSYIFATMNISIIVNIMSFSWGVVAGCFVGPYIWGLFKKNISVVGATTGMVGGLLTIAIPTLIISLSTGFSQAVNFAPEMGVASMIVSVLMVPVGEKLLGKKNNEENIEIRRVA